ncbi:MAG: GGDEF domain-containing protein [Bradyrhizobium sp.]|uniref:GGDEF domain-containing protein n=1 Tax=Bradyrhizobium sp. TaxID=376 RepID=UPI0027195158|nr:GGDEF domain-containing protein [Bradyrhizobium sp.]MDO9560630.1 GGDEF domain-containing protein [Bradyrhizobium sp.]MDP3689960.1 GGDEF domain-containing protein [Bradyrhizobium sp.]
MLSVPTLWTAFIINFLALGLIWAYVTRCYPKFAAAPFWTASAFAAALGASLASLRIVMDSLLPLLAGGTVLIFASCLAAMGVRRFYDRPVGWRQTALITGLGSAGMTLFTFGYDSQPIRMFIYSVAQVLPFVLTIRLLLARENGRVNAGARLAASVAIVIVGIYAMRVTGNLLHIGVEFSFTRFSPIHSLSILALMFLSMSWNFGFLLMAMDRLRNEVADLALLDDLTGVGNRRHLLQRLTEECARSERNGEPFALLVIDLDGFKAINDTHGHAAGDACLQHFTLMAQTRLRPGDLLARTGGDEFCVVLPASTLREGAMIARRILDVCREDAQACVGADIPISLSIGVAQWTREMGTFPDKVIAAADHALYAAKKDGKNRHAVYDPAPPLAPGSDPAAMPERALRKHAQAC